VMIASSAISATPARNSVGSRGEGAADVGEFKAESAQQVSVDTIAAEQITSRRCRNIVAIPRTDRPSRSE
jgi:hypothetical protein